MTILYLGLDPSRFGKAVVHVPLIEIKPLSVPEHLLEDWNLYTHVVLSSRSSLPLVGDLSGKHVVVVGKATAEGIPGAILAPTSDQEGIRRVLRSLDLNGAYVAVCGSKLMREALFDDLIRRGVRHQRLILYDVIERRLPLPDLSAFSEIVFTSPSVVDAFFKQGTLTHQKATCIGPITQERLHFHLARTKNTL